MADDAEQRGAAAPVLGRDGDAVASVVRELLSAVPASCTWLLPVTDGQGCVADFLVAGVSGQVSDIYGRGVGRVDQRLSELYPNMVGGPLWELYREVLTSGSAPGR